MARSFHRRWLRHSVRRLHPASFAIVMATGIISIAAHTQHIDAFALGLLWLNLVVLCLLVFLYAVRLLLFPALMLHDLMNHARGVGYLTFPCGLCVFGAQVVDLLHRPEIAVIFWQIGSVSWALLIYAMFCIYTVELRKPGLEYGINGTWLLAVVATQSVSLLGNMLSSVWSGSTQHMVFFFCLALWLFGGMLYIWIVGLIFYRDLFFKFSAADLTPTHWINMGAVAISALAGAQLVINSERAMFLQQMLPFLRGFTLLFWATGTWWIPALLVLEIWRHGFKQFPLAYSPLYWALVFPLGMYAVATEAIGKVFQLDFLLDAQPYLVYVALIAWCATFAGLAVKLVERLVLRPSDSGAAEHVTRI